MPAGATTGPVTVTAPYGTSVGLPFSITVLPTALTSTPTNVATNSAILRGSVTDNGGATTLIASGIVYVQGTSLPTLADIRVGGGNAYSAVVNGLTPGTTYTYRSYGTNAAGTGYGSPVSFTTLTNTSVVSITRVGPSTSRPVTPVRFTVTFAAPVADLSSYNFAIPTTGSVVAAYIGSGSNGIITTSLTSTGNAYSFDVTATANGPVTVSVPANAAQDAAGNGSIAAAPYSITYSQPATAAPTLTLLSPLDGPAGTSVTLTGTNLGGTTGVSFNGRAASSFVVNSPSSITAIVAAGTTTGPVRVTAPSGLATSADNFVVRVAPTTVADAYPTPQGVLLTGNVLGNDLGTNLRAILIIRPTHGVLALNPDGSFSSQPAAGYSGPDSFIYYACNMGTPLVCGDPATVSIMVGPATSARSAAISARSAAPATKPGAPAAGSAAELVLTGSPNPFAEQLRLSFALPTAQAYTLALYDAQGRLVQQLASGQVEAGQAQQLTVPTRTYAAGLYLLRLSTATGTQLLKLIKQ